MTFDELMIIALSIFPEAEVGEDTDGQVVIHTGLTAVGDSTTPLVSLNEVMTDQPDTDEGVTCRECSATDGAHYLSCSIWGF